MASSRKPVRPLPAIRQERRGAGGLPVPIALIGKPKPSRADAPANLTDHARNWENLRPRSPKTADVYTIGSGCWVVCSVEGVSSTARGFATGGFDSREVSACSRLPVSKKRYCTNRSASPTTSGIRRSVRSISLTCFITHTYLAARGKTLFGNNRGLILKELKARNDRKQYLPRAARLGAQLLR
jgi:hypothetical protein